MLEDTNLPSSDDETSTPQLDNNNHTEEGEEEFDNNNHTDSDVVEENTSNELSLPSLIPQELISFWPGPTDPEPE